MKHWLVLGVVAAVSGCHFPPLGTPASAAAPDPASDVRAAPRLADVGPAGSDVHAETGPEQLPVPQGVARRLTMTLAEFEAIALERHPALAAARAGVEAARGRWIQAGLCPNTVVGYHAGEIGILDTAGKQGGFVSQRLITGGKLRLDRDVAAQDVRRARFNLEAVRHRVLNDVRIRFYDLLVAQREVELTGELVRIGEQSAEASRDLRKGEQISRTNLLQAEVEAETAQILHENARNEHREAWRRLCAVIGVPSLAPASVEGDLEAGLPDLTWEESLAAVLNHSPELDAAGAKVERARLAVYRARRGRIPDVDVMVAVRHDNPTGDDTANVQVGFPIPWLDRNQGNIYRAEAELSAACAELRQLELDLQNRLASAFRRYANAKQQAERYSGRILPRAEESLKLVQDVYREGQVDYLTLLTAQRTFFETSLSYLRSMRDLRESVVVLEGQLLIGSLKPDAR